jgi:molybdopterin converting factor small subunit
MTAGEDATITVVLQLHPLLQSYVPRLGGGKPGALSLSTGTTIDTMLRDVCGLPREIQVFAAVDGRSSPLSSVLQDGDTVSVFMAVGGG